MSLASGLLRRRVWSDFEIEYCVRVSPRARRIAVICEREGFVVRVPVRTSEASLERFLSDPRIEAWIRARKDIHDEPDWDLSHGGFVLFRGERARLEFGARKSEVLRTDEEPVLRLSVPQYASLKQREAALKALLKREADAVIEAAWRRAEARAARRAPFGWARSYGQKRIGVCRADGRILLSWRLVFLPDELVEYVCAHELAHLVEFNHSERFWSVLERALPGARRLAARCREVMRKCPPL